MPRKKRAVIPEPPPDQLRSPDAFLSVIPSLKIKPKRGYLTKFQPWPHQLALYQRVIENRLAGRPTREIHVKARQVGDTTNVAAFVSSECLAVPYTEAIIIVNKDDTLKKVWRIYDRFFSNLDQDLLKNLNIQLPTKGEGEGQDEPEDVARYHSKKEWAGLNGSVISIELASEEASRGGSAMLFHGSECDFWEDFDGTFEAVMSQVPDTPESVVILETTLEGKSQSFRDFVKDSLDGKTGFTVVFVGWLEHEEYRTTLSPDEKLRFQASMSKEERELHQLSGISLERLAWRRDTINSKFKGKVARFKRQFPMNVAEALQFKGDSYFDIEALEFYSLRTQRPNQYSVLDLDPTTRKWTIHSPEELGLEPEKQLRIWREPEPSARYLVCGDIADSEENVVAGDAESFLLVGNPDTGEIVAAWNGKMEPTRFGVLMAAVGHYYNRAMLVPESTGIGRVVCQKLLDLRYPHLYSTERFAEREDGEWKFSKKIGFDTTPRTRPILVRTVQEYVNEMRLDIPDKILVDQMQSFVDKKGGSAPRHKFRAKDDGVIALALFCIASNKRDAWRRRAPQDAYLLKESKEEIAKRGPAYSETRIEQLRRERERSKRFEKYRSMFGRPGGVR